MTPSDAAGGRYVSFAYHDMRAAFSEGSVAGVVMRRLPGHAGEVLLDVSSVPPPVRADRTGMYNGGRYYQGTLTSAVCRTAICFDTLIPSWNARTLSGTWMQLEVRVRADGRWTRWFDMGVWASGEGDVERHSVSRQRHGGWRVSTDVLLSGAAAFADAYRYRLTLFTERWKVTPVVRGVSFAVSDSRRHGEWNGAPAFRDTRGLELAVPVRSQMVYPDGGEAWCSPAALSMTMAYWADQIGDSALDRTLPEVARGTYDHAYRGSGNWSFNAAYAGEFGLAASVARFQSLGQAERWVESKVPLVASVAWDRSGLDGAPMPVSRGHLLVLRGFDQAGNVIVNDPAGRDDSQVRRVYRREQFARAWFESGSGGVAYLVYPRDWSVPAFHPPEATEGG